MKIPSVRRSVVERTTLYPQVCFLPLSFCASFPLTTFSCSFLIRCASFLSLAKHPLPFRPFLLPCHSFSLTPFHTLPAPLLLPLSKTNVPLSYPLYFCQQMQKNIFLVFILLTFFLFHELTPPPPPPLLPTLFPYPFNLFLKFIIYPSLMLYSDKTWAAHHQYILV